MAKNLISPWYPNPLDQTKEQNYIYLKTLESDNKGVYNKALTRFQIAKNTLQQKQFQISGLSDLLKLAEREQKKEDNLLNEIYGEVVDDRTNAQRIQAFNEFYSLKSVYERNLKKIKQIELGSKQGRIDITASFSSYLEKATHKYFSKNLVLKMGQNDFLQITKNALMDMFNSKEVKSTKDDIPRAYQEVASQVEQMNLSDPLIKEVFDLYFGTSFNELKKELAQQKKKKKELSEQEVDKMITNYRGAHGELLELVIEQIVATLSAAGKSKKSTVKRSGKSKQKADVLATYSATFTIPNSLLSPTKIKESVREEFINRYQKFYDKIQGQSGYIVEVSAKNYNLTYETFQEQGFSAQGGVSIKNLQKLLQSYKYNKNITQEMIFALTNIGPDSLSEDSQEVLYHLSLLIGYFLFDDIDMDQNLDVKAIHLFNLDNIYIPLSSFLFAAYETLKDFKNTTEDVVKISYQPEDVNYQKTNLLTKTEWEKYKDKKQKQANISVHFFKNFPKYIAKNL